MKPSNQNFMYTTIPNKKNTRNKVTMKAVVSVQTLFVSLFILYYKIVPWSCHCIKAIDTSNVDDTSEARRHSRRSTNTHQSQRKLQFLKTPTISIVNPKNGALMGKSKVKIDVNYGKETKQSLPFNKFSKIELLMDANRIGVKMLQSAKGQVTFAIDLTNVSDGKHTLTARGVVGSRRRVIQSKKVSISVVSAMEPTSAPTFRPTTAPTSRPTTAPTSRPTTAPTFRPSNAPTLLPTTAPTFRPSNAPTLLPTATPTRHPCDPEVAFLYFTGHDEASSVSRGDVNITWSPAFTYSMQAKSFLLCGNFTYDVFVAQGGFDFRGVNKSIPDLIAFANTSGSNLVRFETKDLQMVVSDLQPGFNYSIMVTAKTDAGHYSYNQNQAEVKISVADPVVKNTFTRLIVLPEPTDTFRVSCSLNESKVSFAGELPKEILELKALDFVYFFHSGGNATMAQLLNQPLPQPSGEALWYFKSTDLTDIFDELSMDVDVTESSKTGNSTDDGVDEIDDAVLEAEFEALDESIKRDFCLAANPGASEECSQVDSNGRRLFFSSLKKKALQVYNKVKKVAQAIVKVLDIPLEFEKSVTWLDLSLSAKLKHRSLEIGLKFDMYAKSHFSLKVSLLRQQYQAYAKLTGGYGLEGYLYFSDAASRSYKPEPKLLFEKTFTNTFLIGVVPIVITNRPSLSTYIELTTAVEGKAMFTASIGYDFEYVFTYDSNRKEKYQKTSSVTRRPNLLPDPTFSLRLNATAEIGMVFAWDFRLYEVLQATTAVDLGLRAELEVGTSLEAMVITSPYFFTLERFEVEAFIRIRLTLGLNLFKDIVRKIKTVGDKLLAIGSEPFQLPTIPPLTNVLPGPLGTALEIAKSHPLYGNATSITLAELTSLVPVQDLQNLYTGIKGVIEGLDLNFELSFVIWSQNFFLLGAPRIALKAAPEGAQICQGANAIVLKVLSQQTKAIIPFLNGLQRNARWFANFDGKLFGEDTDWVLNSDQTNVDSVSLILPRSVTSRPGFSFFEIQDEASVYLRATPEIIPFPKYNMFAKTSLNTLFKVPQFECCDDSDCAIRFGAQSKCTTERLCIAKDRLEVFPATIFVDKPSVISISVYLKSADATGIEEFLVYRFDSSTGVVGSNPIVSLLDVGSGEGNDTVAGDLIYSNVIALRSTFIGEEIGLQVVPVIQGVPKVGSPFTFWNPNVIMSIPGKSNDTSSLLVDGGISYLVLKITYTWSDLFEMDTVTEFLGSKIGFTCNESEASYMNSTNDETTPAGQQTVSVFLGKSFLEGAWKNSTTVKLNADWFDEIPDQGNASVTLSTSQIFDNGSFVDDQNTVSFPINPDLIVDCVQKTVATITIIREGRYTTIDVTQIT